ncbi:MAG: hypothetical protein EOM24_37020 [Chloroflexia bacterium]|nr:hypothetical protein [Chloroflexia bacterium]
MSLGQVSNGKPRWALQGDFRISFFLETSPNPGGSYGNRLGAYIYEMEPGCGALIYPSGYAGLWMGYSAPSSELYYPLEYDDAAYFLFVKQGNTLTIYKGNSSGVREEPTSRVFFGDYLNPAGQFLFGLGTGNPNSGWMRVRDVVITTQGLLACDGQTLIPPEWTIAVSQQEMTEPQATTSGRGIESPPRVADSDRLSFCDTLWEDARVEGCFELFGSGPDGVCTVEIDGCPGMRCLKNHQYVSLDECKHITGGP